MSVNRTRLSREQCSKNEGHIKCVASKNCRSAVPPRTFKAKDPVVTREKAAPVLDDIAGGDSRALPGRSEMVRRPSVPTTQDRVRSQLYTTTSPTTARKWTTTFIYNDIVVSEIKKHRNNAQTRVRRLAMVNRLN
jgi:hypothetical protein